MENSDLVKGTILIAAIGLMLWVYRQVKGITISSTISEGERGLVYRYGRFDREVGPGRHWMVFGRKMTRVPVNEQSFVVANQEIMSADRMAVKTSALVTYKITNPRKAIEKAQGGYYQPLYFAAQLALRDIIAGLPLETLVDTRTTLDTALANRARSEFAEHGCELISMSLRDVTLPADVKRLATDVTRAKMEAAASLERARGEQASLRLLANAARLIKGNPELMNLRVLQALSTGPGKPAPTIILGGSAGIVPVSAGTGDSSPAAEGQDGA